MAKKGKSETNELNEKFKVLNLTKRMSVLETAKTLLKVQKADIAVVDNPSLPMGAKKQE